MIEDGDADKMTDDQKARAKLTAEAFLMLMQELDNAQPNRSLRDLIAEVIGVFMVVTVDQVAKAIPMVAYASMMGFCPFCLEDIKADIPALAGIKKGLRGDALRNYLSDATAALKSKDVDPVTMHRNDCARPRP